MLETDNTFLTAISTSALRIYKSTKKENEPTSMQFFTPLNQAAKTLFATYGATSIHESERTVVLSKRQINRGRT